MSGWIEYGARKRVLLLAPNRWFQLLDVARGMEVFANGSKKSCKFCWLKVCSNRLNRRGEREFKHGFLSCLKIITTERSRWRLSPAWENKCRKKNMLLVEGAWQEVNGNKQQKCAGHVFTKWTGCLLLLAPEKHVEARMKKKAKQILKILKFNRILGEKYYKRQLLPSLRSLWFLSWISACAQRAACHSHAHSL